MTTYNQLKKKFEQDIKQLQKTCPHKKLSEWMDEWWGIGHGTGYTVKTCNKCKKVIKRQHTHYLIQQLNLKTRKPTNECKCHYCQQTRTGKAKTLNKKPETATETTK